MLLLLLLLLLLVLLLQQPAHACTVRLLLRSTGTGGADTSTVDAAASPSTIMYLANGSDKSSGSDQSGPRICLIHYM